MAELRATRTVQYPVVAEFVFNYNDTMKDVDGALQTFGSDYTDAGNFEIIPLPRGAVIVGGEVIVETQGAGPTAYTASVGDADSATVLASAVDLLAAAGTRYALSLTSPLAINDGKNVRLKIASTVANATAGKFRVRVMYTLDGKANEVSAV